MPIKKLPFANVENLELAVKAPATMAISPRKKQVKNAIVYQSGCLISPRDAFGVFVCMWLFTPVVRSF